ncbi:NADH-quinone oxidoreductase subunit C [Streptomyces sp. V1I6]|uniref:NADH-quinone oxidoreductase subunit C n=1 Tax=Streptomyces sp. V1I6 TaxID=3042273 RepID=UPI00278340A9|nr:NADH-quinone oxidoreductase subunit C [Streptomyces sp. V1I6]MDQ0844414.1 NADH:ubiquinone oxidoreductase subunit C [Streptomyces sp. V1I6]
MNLYDSLPDAVTEIFGEEATAERTYELLTVDVPVGSWITALKIARDKLGCTYFDWLSAVDEPGTGFRICAHVVSLEGRAVRRLLVRTTVPHGAPSLPSAVDVYAGASWHERETHEMFGVDFTGHPHQVPLLLPDGFEGHPLRKDFVLAARVAKAWPGAKEPGESEHGGPKRRQMLPPGVPDPNEWGPLKGQLPPAPARPARTPRAGAAAAGAGAGERPPRRTRSAGEGSASQGETPAAAPRRSRSASEGSASQGETPAAGPRRSRSASEGSASQAGTRTTPSAGGTDAPEPSTAPEAPGGPGASGAPGATEKARPTGPAEGTTPPRSRSSDAPWHHARPAFEDTETAPEPPAPKDSTPEPGTGTEPGTEPGAGPTANVGAESRPEPGAGPGPAAGAEPEAGPEREAGVESRPEPAAEPAPEAGADPEAGTEREAGAESRPEPAAGPAPEAGAGPEAGADPEAGPGRGAEPDSAPENPTPSPPSTPAPGSADGPDDDEANRPAGGDPA